MRISLRKNMEPANQQAPVEGDAVPLDRGRHLPAATQWRPDLAAHAEEDAAWDWSELLREADGNHASGAGQYEAHALECEGEVQAIMLLETAAHRSRQTGAVLVYVEYLAVAPWNRRAIQLPPRFAGCGSGMISVAIERSRVLGLGGAIALHSLPGASGFYTRLGLADLGLDPSENGLQYFEMV